MSEVVENGKWRDLRMHRRDLEVAGKAMLTFGIWTLLRVLFGIMLGDTQLDAFVNSMIPEGSTDIDAMVAVVVSIAVLILLGLIGLLLHFLIYRGAAKEGRGKKVGYLYLVLTVLLAGSCVYSIIYTLTNLTGELYIMLSDFLFDFTLIIICIDILYNGIRSKKLKKELGA